MRVPQLLQPWADWLALFPLDQAELISDLLLRLAPLVGPLRRQAATAAQEPQGVGAITQRGSYERLLISEWGMFDAVPDEFIRRAANRELLFTGPEPATSQRPLRSVVLFDAGPSQLGAPRLLHVALFILLARRAEMAGAAFQWGVLQAPGELHTKLGAPAFKRLLESRSYAGAVPQALSEWDALLDGAIDDGWLIGGAGEAPAAIRARAVVRRSWSADELSLALTQHGRTRTLALPLPDQDSAVRLLRQVATPDNRALAYVTAPRAHSLKRAPLFGTHANCIAVATPGGQMALYHVPQSVRTPPGKPALASKLPNFETIVAAGLFKRSLGFLAIRNGALHPSGFPGKLFSGANVSNLAMPDPQQFSAVPGRARWAPAFHFRCSTTVERIIVLDPEGRLVCWTRKMSGMGMGLSDEFTVIASAVIGVRQDGPILIFAAVEEECTVIHHLGGLDLKLTRGEALDHIGDLCHLGAPDGYALRLPERRWLVGDSFDGAVLEVEQDCEVLGCARGPANQPGMVILRANKTQIECRTADSRQVLVDSSEKIVQASCDPRTGRVAWLTYHSGMLVVQGFGETQPYLQAASKEALDAG